MVADQKLLWTLTAQALLTTLVLVCYLVQQVGHETRAETSWWYQPNHVCVNDFLIRASIAQSRLWNQSQVHSSPLQKHRTTGARNGLQLPEGEIKLLPKQHA
jgi:hypothetical protein